MKIKTPCSLQNVKRKPRTTESFMCLSFLLLKMFSIFSNVILWDGKNPMQYQKYWKGNPNKVSLQKYPIVNFKLTF